MFNIIYIYIVMYRQTISMCLYLYTQAAWFLFAGTGASGRGLHQWQYHLVLQRSTAGTSTETEGDWGLLGDLEK